VNPYTIIAALVACLGAGWGGFALGVDHQKASQIDKQDGIAQAVEAANKSAAVAIAALRPRYTTIQNEVQREIQTHTVFADCKLPADSLRLANQALSGGSEPAGGGKLPPIDAAK
jgi:hypothetical protein